MFELPKLDYSNSALSPIMSEQTLDLHYGKHHQTYITNLNNFIKGSEYEELSLEDIIKKSSNEKKVGIFNNASQHWNHNLFWKCMKPNGGGNVPSKLENKIKEDFGGFEKFREEFINAGVTQFGSGWCKGKNIKITFDDFLIISSKDNFSYSEPFIKLFRFVIYV